MAVQRVADVDLRQLTQQREFFKSPPAWEDQVFYFLMLDRFSDGNEAGYRGDDGQVVDGGTTPPFRPEDNGNAIGTEDEAARWREAGGRWVGGTCAGWRASWGT